MTVLCIINCSGDMSRFTVGAKSKNASVNWTSLNGDEQKKGGNKKETGKKSRQGRERLRERRWTMVEQF